MTKIEKLNRRMLLLEREVSISCEEYDTYKALTEAAGMLKLVVDLAAMCIVSDEADDIKVSDEALIAKAREALENLK